MKNKSKSLKVLKALLAFCWWGTIGGAVVVTVFIAFVAISPSRILGDGVVLNDVSFDGSVTGFAGSIDASSLSAVTRDGVVADVEFRDPVRLKITLPAEHWESRRHLLVYGWLALLVVMGLFLLFVKLLREIVWSVEAGNPFVAQNAERLRKMGGLIIVGAFAESLKNLISSGYADTVLIPSGFSLDGHLGFSFGTLMIGLSVIVLSEVFRIGIAMREEQELTV